MTTQLRRIDTVKDTNSHQSEFGSSRLMKPEVSQDPPDNAANNREPRNMDDSKLQMSRRLMVERELIPRDANPGVDGERSIFVVVGMHRSGTSLCSNVLGLLGVNMADEAGENHSNPLGHFERWEIMELQDEVLSLFDRGYHSLSHDYPLPPAWWADFRLRPLKERLKSCLTTIMSRSDLFGFKDPRTTRLLPMWHQIFAELKLNPRFVVCLRDPAHVAASLLARDKLELEVGEMRALDYIVDALRHTRGTDRCFIRYDDWMTNPMLNAMKLSHFVNYPAPFEARELEIAIQAVVRPEANRSGRHEIKARQALIRNFFDLVNRFAESNGADQSLDTGIESFTHSYIAFRQMLGPFEAQQKSIAIKLSNAEEQRTSAWLELTEAKQALAAEQAAALKDKEALQEALVRAQQSEYVLAEQAKRIGELTDALATAEAERGLIRPAQGKIKGISEIVKPPKFFLDEVVRLDRVILAKGWSELSCSQSFKLIMSGVKAEITSSAKREDLIRHFGNDAAAWTFSAVFVFPTPEEAAKAALGRLVIETENFTKTIEQPGLFFSNLVPQAHQILTERFFQEIKNSKQPPSVLEIGSRARSGVSRRELFPNCHYVGLDIIEGPNVDIVGDAHRLSRVTAEKFDFVFSMAVFEHLLMPWKVAIEIARVMNVGGYAYIWAPSTWPPHDEPWDYWRYTKNTWHALFNKYTGFELVGAEYQTPCHIIERHESGSPFSDFKSQLAYYATICLARKICEPSLDWDLNAEQIVKDHYPA